MRGIRSNLDHIVQQNRLRAARGRTVLGGEAGEALAKAAAMVTISHRVQVVEEVIDGVKRRVSYDLHSLDDKRRLILP